MMVNNMDNYSINPIRNYVTQPPVKNDRINTSTRTVYHDDTIEKVNTVLKQDHERVRALIEQKLNAALESLKDPKFSPGLDKDAAQHLKDAFILNNVAVRFEMDNELKHKLLMQLVDKNTGEVVWQLPPEYSVRMQKLAKLFPGIFLNELI